MISGEDPFARQAGLVSRSRPTAPLHALNDRDRLARGLAPRARSERLRTRPPTIWVAEGLLPYLSPEAQAELLGAIHELSGPGSALVLDRISGDPTAPGRLRGLSERSGIDMAKLLVTGTNEDLAGFLNAKGWDLREEPTATIADRYKRDLSNPSPPRPAGSQPSEPPWLDTIFLSAHQPA